MTTAPALEESRPDRARQPAPGLDLRGLGLYGVTVLIWGTSWLALRLQLGEVAPEVSSLWRFLIAGAVTLAWVLLRGERLRFPAADHLRFAGVGACMFSCNFVLFYYAGFTIASGLLSVVFSLTSIITLGLGALVLRQRVETRVALGGLCGAIGIGLLFGPGIAGAGLYRAALAGLGLSLAGTLFFSAGNLVSASVQHRGVPILAANAWGMLYGILILLALCLLRGLPFTLDPSPAYLGSLLYLALPSTVVAFACYVALLRRIGPARAGYATVLFPLVALTVSTMVEGYRWTPLAACGAALALAGNLLVLRGPRR